MRSHALLLMLALSGCLGAPLGPVPDSTVAGSSPLEIAWGITECRFLIGVIRFDPALAADLLPEGFAFAVGDGLPLPVEVEPAVRASLGVEAFRCAEGAGLNGTVAPLAYGSFYFNVIPPADLSAGDDAGHYYKLSVLVPDEQRRAWLEAAGADVVNGSVQVADDPLGRAATMRMDGVGDVRLRSLNVQENPGFDDFVFREFTPARDGLVLWDAVASSPGTFSGRGLLEVPEGSLPARLMGGVAGVVDMFGGTYTFSNGTVALPG